MRGFLTQIEHNNGRGGKYHMYELSLKPQLVFDVVRIGDEQYGSTVYGAF